MAKDAQAAGTAIGPMSIVATEQFLPPAQRIVNDPLAASLLPGSTRFFVDLCRWAPIRQLMFRMSESVAPGVWGSMLCRKRCFDDVVADFIAERTGAVVFLGAGFDTRACRFVAPAGVSAFEADLPENTAAKQAALERAIGGVPEHVHLVALDFEQADLGQALAASGFDIGAPALFVWEGVTQYLTEPAVRKTFEFLSNAAPGSRLAFTYVLKDFIAGRNMFGAEKLFKRFVEGYRIWHFGLAPEEVPGFLSDYGWRQVEQVGAEHCGPRYLQPTGRNLKVLEIERIVLAEKAR